MMLYRYWPLKKRIPRGWHVVCPRMLGNHGRYSKLIGKSA